MTAAVAEFDYALISIFPTSMTKWLFLPFLLVALFYFSRDRRSLTRFIDLAARQPASGFIAAALVLIYVFSGFFGSSAFWKATLESDFHPDLPRICQEYLELLACYFIFVGVVGFCLSAGRPDPSGSSE